MIDNIKVVLFDLGRVLMHIDFDAFPNGLGLVTEEQRAPFQQPIGKLWRTYETGRMTTDEFLHHLFLIFNCSFTKEHILEAWNKIIVCDNEAIVPLVRKIQKNYRTAILSNTSPSHWEKILQVSDLAKSIPHHFTSFSIGAMKPEPVVYEYVVSSLNVQPNQIIFIDDLTENVEGAVKFGMQGIVYKSPFDIEERLFR
jgi:FMN phosphatase YigB (HAD superfamily)